MKTNKTVITLVAAYMPGLGGCDPSEAAPALDAAPRAAEVQASPTQSFATLGAEDFESFSIGTEHFLAIANTWDGASLAPSSVLRYDAAQGHFVPLQDIPTQWAMDWEHVEIGGEHYLAVANHRTVTPWTANVDSKIYRWDGAQFVEHQVVATHGATDWEHARIGGEDYLVVANATDDLGFDIDSEVLRFDPATGTFVHHQGLPTRHAAALETFEVGGEAYLAVANFKGGAPGSSTKEVDSTIWRWNPSLDQYELFQSIATQGASDWAHLQIDDEHYLAVANGGSDASGNVDSVLYRWDGAAFVDHQHIPTHGASDLEVVHNGLLTGLAVANTFKSGSYSTNSHLYDWGGQAFGDPQAILTHGARRIEHIEVEGLHYLAVANGRDDAGYAVPSEIRNADYAPDVDMVEGSAWVYMRAKTWVEDTQGPLDLIDLTMTPQDGSWDVESSVDAPGQGSAHASADMLVDLDYMVPNDHRSGRVEVVGSRGATAEPTIADYSQMRGRYTLELEPLEDCTLHLRLRVGGQTDGEVISATFGLLFGDPSEVIDVYAQGDLPVIERLDVPLTAGQTHYLRLDALSGHSSSGGPESSGYEVDMDVAAEWYID